MSALPTSASELRLIETAREIAARGRAIGEDGLQPGMDLLAGEHRHHAVTCP